MGQNLKEDMILVKSVEQESFNGLMDRFMKVVWKMTNFMVYFIYIKRIWCILMGGWSKIHW